jgi:hypothetical protein
VSTPPPHGVRIVLVKENDDGEELAVMYTTAPLPTQALVEWHASGLTPHRMLASCLVTPAERHRRLIRFLSIIAMHPSSTRVIVGYNLGILMAVRLWFIVAGVHFDFNCFYHRPCAHPKILELVVLGRETLVC